MVRTADQWLVIDHHSFAGTHGGRRASQVCKDQKGLSLHLQVLAFRGDDIDDLAVCCEEREKLDFGCFLFDLVIEIVDIKHFVRLICEANAPCHLFRAMQWWRWLHKVLHLSF